MNRINKLPSSEHRGTDALVNPPVVNNQNYITLALPPCSQNNQSSFKTNPTNLAGTFSSAMTRSIRNELRNK